MKKWIIGAVCLAVVLGGLFLYCNTYSRLSPSKVEKIVFMDGTVEMELSQEEMQRFAELYNTSEFCV